MALIYRANVSSIDKSSSGRISCSVGGGRRRCPGTFGNKDSLISARYMIEVPCWAKASRRRSTFSSAGTLVRLPKVSTSSEPTVSRLEAALSRGPKERTNFSFGEVPATKVRAGADMRYTPAPVVAVFKPLHGNASRTSTTATATTSSTEIAAQRTDGARIIETGNFGWRIELISQFVKLDCTLIDNHKISFNHGRRFNVAKATISIGRLSMATVDITHLIVESICVIRGQARNTCTIASSGSTSVWMYWNPFCA